MPKRHRAQRASLLLAIVAGLLASEDSRALLIDDFTTDQTTMVIQPDTDANNQVSGATILGGERDLEVTRDSGVGVTMVVAGGTLSYGHIAASLGSGSIVYDGVDGDVALDPTGLGGVDFTDGGASTGIGIDILLNDLAASMTLVAYTDAINFSVVTVPLPGNIPPDPQTLLEVLFTDFATAGGTGVDFSNVGAFELSIDGSAVSALDVEMNSIRTMSVPEPSADALLLTGLIGIAWVRRRRRFRLSRKQLRQD